MMRGAFSRTSWLPTALLVCACAFAPAPAIAAANSAWDRLAPAMAVVDSLLARNDMPGASARLDALEAAARASGDAAAARVASVRRVRVLYGQKRVAEGFELARELRRAARDTIVWIRADLQQGRALELEQKQAEAQRLYRQGLALARAARLPAEEASALTRLGYVHLFARRSELARQHFAAALELSRRQADDEAVLRDLGALARATYFLGRIPEARRLYRETIDVARRHGALVEEISMQLNLGFLEIEAGDPDAAPAWFREALRGSRAAHHDEYWTSASRELARLAIAAGDWAQADSLLTDALPVARGLPARAGYAGILVQLAQVRQSQGRETEAFALVRQVAALCDTTYPFQAEDLAGQVWWVMLQAGRWGDAYTFADTTGARLHARGITKLKQLDFYRDWALSRSGRPREALPRLRAEAGAPDALNAGGYSIIDVYERGEIAHAYHALGRVDSALVWFRAATRAWERSWSTAEDPGLRRDTEDTGNDLGFEYALALLDARRRITAPSRALEAFAMLQRYHARILAEQTLGPEQGGARALGAFDVAAFRARTLRPGEVYLDFTPNADSTLVIAVTRDSVRAWFVAGRRSLDERLTRFAGLLERPSNGNADAWRLPAAALGRELLGPVAPWITRAPRVLFAAGSLGARPLGLLIAPGAREPVSAERDVAFVPSAALLAAARAATGARPVAHDALVALARTTNDRGQKLDGAAAEVRELSSRFAGVTALVDPARGAGVLARQSLARGAIVHLAAHAQLDERRPWRSGLLIGDPRGRDGWLRASVIARLRVPARLVVLSSCRSAGAAGTDLSALQGLAPAWMSAGVPTVLAAQWNVDDATTARLMRAFYGQLARGLGASAALRAAQRVLRDDPATAAPRHWAGFVVMGEPETRVALAARR